MRNKLLPLLFAMLAATCSKSDDNPTPPKNTFSASVNGVAFVPAEIEVLISGSGSPGTKAVNVYATNANGLELTLHMYDYDGTRSAFPLSEVGSMGSYCLLNCGFINSTSTYSKSGEVKITSFDKNRYKDGEVIIGNFNFQTDDATGKYNVSNGQFRLFVPEQ